MSTIDIGATLSPQSRPHSLRTMASPINPPMAQTIDDGDFYIGSTKISTLPLHNAAQAARLTSAK